MLVHRRCLDPIDNERCETCLGRLIPICIDVRSAQIVQLVRGVVKYLGQTWLKPLAKESLGIADANPMHVLANFAGSGRVVRLQ